MRAFISIKIPNSVKKQIKKIQDKLPEFIGKKTEFENLHLTLKFLGEVSEDEILIIKKKLKEIKVKSFRVEIDSIGIFSKDFIRIVWLHLTNCNELQKQIDEKLKDLFKKENRFMSHLTIARIKKVDKKLFLEELKNIKIPKISFIVNDFALNKSVLSKKAPIYKEIAII
jgi:2'-5' RNA ligase